MGLSFLKHNLAVPHPRILQKVEWSPSEAAAEYKDLSGGLATIQVFPSRSLCAAHHSNSRVPGFSECSLEGVHAGGSALWRECSLEVRPRKAQESVRDSHPPSLLEGSCHFVEAKE